MSGRYIGDFNTTQTVVVMFQTFDSNGGSVTITGLAVTDIEIYKGSSVTQRSSDNGYALIDTDGIDIDGATGIHGFTVDLSDNSDASFYAAGNDYYIVVNAITVNAQTVRFLAAHFSIENRNIKANVTQFNGSNGTFASGRPEVNVSHVGGTAITATGGRMEVNTSHIAGSAVSTSTAQIGVNVVNFGGSAGTFASGVPEVSLTTSSRNAVADQVWDEASSGHVTAGSFGAALFTIRAGTAQAGAGTTITLDASASAVDDFYNNQRIHIVAGTGVGQGRIISDYVGSTKVATVATWGTNPSSDSVFVILPFGSIPGASAPTAAEVADAVWDEAATDHTTDGSFGQYLGKEVTRTGTAQAGTTTSITLDAGASSTTNQYRFHRLECIGGTAAGQTSYITAYNGTSKVATLDPALATAPSSDTVFLLRKMGLDAATPGLVADAVWDEARSGHVAAGSFGEYVPADAVRFSGDATAADNAEAFFDGTGYAGTNNVIPTVTSVTNQVTANVAQISGDTTAADNAEAFFDGTGYAGTGNTIPTVTTVGTVSGNVNGNVGGNVTGSVGSLAAQAKADVNAEVVDALATDTYAEPGQGNPAATTTIAAKINYLYKAWRNKKDQDDTTQRLYNDDGTTVGQKATISDVAGTTTWGEMATGA